MRQAPGAYSLLRNLRRGDSIQSLLRLRTSWQHYKIQHQNNGIFAIRIDAPFGFFAFMKSYLLILWHCERRGLYPYVVFNGSAYSSGTNWLYNYFDPRTPLNPDIEFRVQTGAIRLSTISTPHDLLLSIRYDRQLTLESAHALITRHLGLKAPIRAELDRFCTAHFGNDQVLGIHYRGTDKHEEAPPVARAVMIRRARQMVRGGDRFRQVFVASDEPDFIAELRAAVAGVRVVSWKSEMRGRPLDEPYEHGREALLNCLILSRCTHCLRTCSSLSGWATIFNPKLPVTVLNRARPYARWFPEEEIYRSQTGVAMSAAGLEFPLPIGHGAPAPPAPTAERGGRLDRVDSRRS